MVIGVTSLLLWAAPAQARFEPVETFANSEVAALGGEGVAGVAVNDSTGDVYVDDPRNHRVERFSARGEFIESWGWGVATGDEEFQTCVTGCQSGLAGTENGQFVRPQGIAVDQATGSVYVLDTGRTSGIVQKFSSEGAYLAGFGEDGEGVEDIGGVEVNHNSITVAADGDVYVLDEGAEHGPRAMAFGSSGNYLPGHDIGVGVLSSPTAIASDSHGDILVIDTACVVDKFEASGALVWQTPEACEKQSLATDLSNDGVFFYSKKGNDFRQLDAAGKEVASFPGAGDQEFSFGLAFNPNVTWAPGDPSGVLYVINFNELTEVAEGIIFAQPPIVPPSVEAETVEGVDAGSATLHARIDPHGTDTRYRFQYGSTGPCSANPCAETPQGGGDLGSAEEAVAAAASVSGLVPGTTYFYRVVAANSAGSVPGPDQSFHTFALQPPGLPDGRAYEMVSPPEKNGGEVLPPEPSGGSCASGECKPGINNAAAPMQSASDGNAIAYVGLPFFGGSGSSGANQYLAVRGSGGWETHAVSPTGQGEGESQGFKSFSSDLSQGLLFMIEPTLTAGAPPGYANLYARDNATGSFQPLVTESPPHRTAGSGSANAFHLTLAGASADFRDVVFEANDTLTTNAVDGGPSETNLYEWNHGELSLVNVLSGGVTTGPGAVFGSGEELTGATGGQDLSHAISDDGARIFWTDQNTGNVYLREDNTSTIQIPDSGRFLTASSDGAKVLLNDGHMYDVERKAVVDLTGGAGGFVGILGAADDLSRIYFVDAATLDGEGAAGENNLYLWSGGGAKFIATLAPGDGATWFLSAQALASDWAAAPSHRTAQVTPDGRYLAFMSKADVTGFDNTVSSGECSHGGGTTCFEIYEYDVASQQLICASCSPAGQRPMGSANLSLIKPGGNADLAQPRNLADDGRLFFDSLDVLAPGDTNGRAQDVYEYEPAGEGSCDSSPGGCVALISSGHGSADSNFVAASPDGRNAFFTSREQLAPQDRDGLLDLYDARVGGGFPSPTAAAACIGEACRQKSSSAPVFSATLSASFSGAGNLVPAVAPPKTAKMAKQLTRAQKLATALKACKQTPKRRRAACETRARKKYGPVRKAKKRAKTSGHETSRRAH